MSNGSAIRQATEQKQIVNEAAKVNVQQAKSLLSEVGHTVSFNKLDKQYVYLNKKKIQKQEIKAKAFEKKYKKTIKSAKYKAGDSAKIKKAYRIYQKQIEHNAIAENLSNTTRTKTVRKIIVDKATDTLVKKPVKTVAKGAGNATARVFFGKEYKQVLGNVKTASLLGENAKDILGGNIRKNFKSIAESSPFKATSKVVKTTPKAMIKSFVVGKKIGELVKKSTDPKELAVLMGQTGIRFVLSSMSLVLKLVVRAFRKLVVSIASFMSSTVLLAIVPVVVILLMLCGVSGTSNNKTKIPKGRNGLAYGGQCVWPVKDSYIVTSCFGPRWGTNHNGIDINAPMRSVILAVDDGTVTVSQYSDSAGNFIMVQHKDYVSVYMHNDELLVDVGDNVEGGQQIAWSGNTGNTTGPHCHLGIQVDGVYVDPAPYLGIPSGLGFSENEDASPYLNKYDDDGEYYDAMAHTDGDLNLLAAILATEAYMDDPEGMLAVGTVIMNRVVSPSYPNTLYDVIHQPMQFEATWINNRFDNYVAYGAPQKAKAVAEELLKGKRTSILMEHSCTQFRTDFPEYRSSYPNGVSIGGNWYFWD